MSSLLAAAYEYLKKDNVCPIAINSDKRAFLPWKKYQQECITMQELEQQFEHPLAQYIAIVCGPTSGNLEVIDIDSKYDLTGTLFKEYYHAIKDNDEDLAGSLRIVKTVSGGFHLYYRCDQIGINQKLAGRPSTEQELKADPNDKVKVLIETRGSGGYVAAPPSQGYTYAQKRVIPTISVEQRDILIELARSFNKIIAPPTPVSTGKYYQAKEYGLSPFEDFNRRGDIVGLLQAHGWTVVGPERNGRIFFKRPGNSTAKTSGDFHRDKNWFSVFTTSSQFEPNKAYLPYAVYTVLEHNGDYSAAAKALLATGYGERWEHGDKLEKEVYRKRSEGANKEQLVHFIHQSYKKSKEEAEDIIVQLVDRWGPDILEFWDVNVKTGKLEISRGKLVDFLNKSGGFSLYYYDDKSTIFRVVRNTGGFVEEVSSEHIKKFLKDYIWGLPDKFDGNKHPHELLEVLMKGAETLFSKGLIEFLDRSDFEFLKDTKDEAYFPFRNGVVKITRDNIELLSYKDIKRVIWKSQVIDAEIGIEDNLDVTLVEYMKFLNLISANDPDRRDYAMTLIGYLLHQYKDPTHGFAVILGEETDNENEGGGTGKGIFMKAISKIANTERVDGKNFKLDKTFAFQRVGLDTRVLSIEDVRQKVDFEGFYSIITEGITVEKKNKDELYIPYEDSPKIVFTTNYSIPSIGNHAKRRQRVFEFSSYFSPRHTPEDEFGHKLFNDWDKDEWNRFYNLMFFCVQSYMQEGVKEIPSTAQYKRKGLKLKYGDDFLGWFETYNWSEWVFFGDAYNDFLNTNGLEKKDYSIKAFKTALKGTAESFEMFFVERINRQNNNMKQVRISPVLRHVDEREVGLDIPPKTGNGVDF